MPEATRTVSADAGAGETRRLRPTTFARLRRRPPLIAHLSAFALAIMIPALLFSAFLIVRFSQQQAEIAAAQVSDTAEILSDTIDRELSTMITMARVLASSPAIDGGDMTDFVERTTSALSMSNADAILIDPALRIVADTRGAAAAGDAGEDVAAEERVFRTRAPLVSDVFRSERSDDFVFHVAVPVTRGDRVLYVLSLTRPARDLGSFVADRNLPATWSALVTDRSGHRVAAALATGGQARQNRGVDFDNPTVDHAFAEMAGQSLIEASYTSSLSGWKTSVAVPDAVIGQPMTRSWSLLAVAGLLLLAFSVAMAMFFGRRLVVAPIRSLARQADAIGKGRPAHPVTTRIAEIGDVSRVLAQASRERRDAEEQTQFLMREMTHRAKNQYALIAAIARRAAKESVDTGAFLDTLSEALNSLARSADLLAGRGWESATLSDLVLTQLKAFGAADAEQFEMSGPEVKLNPTAAQTIGLALHELATNAAKYGSLSVPDGYVRIEWSLDERFQLSWREIGGPPVTVPKRSGFGTLVVQKMTSRGLGGEVDMAFASSGVVWRLLCPPETVLAH